MSKLFQGGIGVALMGLALVLPSLQFSFLDLTQVNQYFLFIIQIGLVIAGLGYAGGDS